QGVALGCVASISIVILAVLAGIRSQITNLEVVWNLRIGLFLTAVTLTTRFMSAVTAFLVPAILAGMLSFDHMPTLNGTAKKLCQLMEAFMSRGLLSTGKACFHSGKIRKLSIPLASVLVFQCVLSATDLYLHVTAVARSQQIPGKKISSTRALYIETNCSNNFYSFTYGSVGKPK
ncbi:6083_t:CDS:1, partial [Acaulospora morrowiae]